MSDNDETFDFEAMERALDDPLEVVPTVDLLNALAKRHITMTFAGVMSIKGGANIKVGTKLKGKRKHLDVCLKTLSDRIDDQKWGPGEEKI